LNTPNSEKIPSIMVIEDSVDSRLLVEVALQDENYHVITAESGIQALELLEEGACPDLILLDLSMPEMPGDQFMIELRKHEHCSHSKVLVVSGWDDVSQRAQDIGATGYLRKPFDLRVLAREVRKHLARNG
jgi:CheY-like chemotaxis protein